jgi:hypothetical protein
VVSREVARHGGRTGYRAVAANTTAQAARERPNLLAAERCARLRAVVGELLRVGCSPASIAVAERLSGDQGCLDREVPADLQVPVVLNNASTRKTPTIKRWPTAHPRVVLHLTPTNPS